jgi:hypothetical protein
MRPRGPTAHRACTCQVAAPRSCWLAGMIVTAALLMIGSFLAGARDLWTGAVGASPPVAVPLTAYPGFEQAPSLVPRRKSGRVFLEWRHAE